MPHRWFATLYDPINRMSERRVVGPLRRRLLADLSGDVLEVGAGTGANFEHYPPSARVIATEPDPHMLRRAQAKLATSGATNIDARMASAEQLPFPDASFDAVVCTLVLCTAGDVPRALAEMRRVLRPGGRLVFLEHVRGEGRLGRFHDLVLPVWRWCGAGCHPNRRTEAAISAAGFEITSLDRTKLMSVVPGIYGVAARD